MHFFKKISKAYEENKKILKKILSKVSKRKINTATKSELVMHASCLFVLSVLPAPVYFPT